MQEKISSLSSSRLKLLGDPRWVYEKYGDEVRNPTITIEPSETPVFVGLYVFSETPDRIFLLQKRDCELNERIDVLQSELNSLDFILTLTGLTVDTNSISLSSGQ